MCIRGSSLNELLMIDVDKILAMGKCKARKVLLDRFRVAYLTEQRLSATVIAIEKNKLMLERSKLKNRV